MFEGVQVFSATLARERAELGERVTEWLRSSKVEIVDTVVRQSSDREFHCLSVIIFYKGKEGARAQHRQRARRH